MASDFAKMTVLCKRYRINEPTRIFKLHEWGLSMRGTTFGRAKCIAEDRFPCNTRYHKFLGAGDHVTLFSFVTATGKVFTTLVVLPRCEEKCCKRSNSKFKTPADIRPTPNYFFMNLVFGVYIGSLYDCRPVGAQLFRGNKVSTKRGKDTNVSDACFCLSNLLDSNVIVS